METAEARTTNSDQDMDEILRVLDSRWKRSAVNALLGENLKGGRIYDLSAGSGENQIEYMDQDFKFLAHSFREKEGYFYVIEMKEVRKAPKAYDVVVYRFDPVDNCVEELFLKGCRSNEPLAAQREAANVFREFRDCEDIEDQLNSHMIVDYESKRDAIKANENSRIQHVCYDSLEKALNRQLVKPGDPVLVYYESDEFHMETRVRCVSDFGVIRQKEVEEEVRDNYILMFRMPEERFCIRSIVSGETSGDYIDLHDVWMQRPALEGYFLRQDDSEPGRFRKSGDERFYLERGVMNFGSFLVALGHEAITKVMMDPNIKEKYGVGFRPFRYNIYQALSMLAGKPERTENNHGG